ncbi:hypothetical protein NDU88_004928 [Pleurodeles waltl]|uniref:Uncharacterized protein n=1 Tax=Pleurodeles waltl TaxID=8319 RepID=A0AAV7RH14_PLEWA|nr:hypothetical protein NDU88_004928 [Pleurodeles waltl]
MCGTVAGRELVWLEAPSVAMKEAKGRLGRQGDGGGHHEAKGPDRSTRILEALEGCSDSQKLGEAQSLLRYGFRRTTPIMKILPWPTRGEIEDCFDFLLFFLCLDLPKRPKDLEWDDDDLGLHFRSQDLPLDWDLDLRRVACQTAISFRDCSLRAFGCMAQHSEHDF